MYIDTVVAASIVTILAMLGSLVGMGVYAYKHVKAEENSGRQD